MTTEEFTRTQDYRSLGPVGMVFIYGYHSEEAARFDYNAFEALLAPRGVALLHHVGSTRVFGMTVRIVV